MGVRGSVLLRGLWASGLVVALFVGGGCQRSGPAATSPAEPPAQGSAPAATAKPAAPVSDAAPNELGRVPVLEYHVIGPTEGRWARTPAAFRGDLEWLYQHGFRAVSMRDYVTGNIDLPPGASPVVFTFDDATEGQFRYLEKDGELVIDPDCAVGILEAFVREHPDFGLKATFYVLPESAFGQPQHRARKLQYLVERGMELGNHTVSHTALKKLSNERVQEELAGAQQQVQASVPGYQFFSLALPLGIKPREASLAHKGAWNGMSYTHEAVLLVGSTPAPSPFDKDFDSQNIQRVQATDLVEEPYRLSVQLKTLMEKTDRRYVSDGDPNTIAVPASLQDEVGGPRVQGKQVKVVGSAE